MNKKESGLTEPLERYRLLFQGIVQGVGFRPYLYRVAKKFKLNGFVKNTSEGVILEVEGRDLEDFVPYVLNHLPPLSEVVNYHVSKIPSQFSKEFQILSSESTEKSELFVSPDIAICKNCKKELSLPSDRRYRYPFINCTDCGPRLTIIKDLPYDRPKTTMAKFTMCPDCSNEYHDPMDRRYHAQPVSCFHCGPTLTLRDRNGLKIESDSPLLDTCQKIKQGYIIAIKGLGGYHLAGLASSDQALLNLRKYKKRERKPFALMGTIKMIREHCLVSDVEENYLLSPAAPILLLRKKQTASISPHVAPGQNTIGFMVPYTPLHILLLQKVGEPLVMTSANISDEPIIYKDNFQILGSLADYILCHDRDIHLFADDSVAQVFNQRLYMIRRSRGYVPFPITIPFNSSKIVLGLGPMLKTTFTVIRGNKALTSSYIGDTESPSAITAERFAIQHYMKLFSFSPDILVIDKHPAYPNRLLVSDFPNAKVLEIQHHKAHVGALLAETGETGSIIGISMDGTGYGDDGKIWGGEFFVGNYKHLSRFGHLKNLFLPAGDRSIKEPWRFALSVLVSLYGPEHERVSRFVDKFGKKGFQQLEVLKEPSGKFGVFTSSCGRIFDAAASLLGIGDYSDFDGDLPSRLQACAERDNPNDKVYGFSMEKIEKFTILNLLPLFHDIINDRRSLSEKAFSFHYTLAKGIVSMAESARQEFDIETAGLCGGVFQNTLLLRMTMNELIEKGFQVLIPSEIPTNDGGISLGQAYLAAATIENL